MDMILGTDVKPMFDKEQLPMHRHNFFAYICTDRLIFKSSITPSLLYSPSLSFAILSQSLWWMA